MHSMDNIVNLRVKFSGFAAMLHSIAALPKPLRPNYFTVGERVRNKEASRIDNTETFSAFVDEHVRRMSGCDLIGDKISYGIFVGAARDAQRQPTHVGCSVILRGPRWHPHDLEFLLRQLCTFPVVESAEACLREEWIHRHKYVKDIGDMSISGTLGVDISASLPGLYWWTVFSDDLAQRHNLDLNNLSTCTPLIERWVDGTGRVLHALRLYAAPQKWQEEEGRVSAFLQQHSNFFSMTRIQPAINASQTQEEFDATVRPYEHGQVPWEG